MEWDLLAIAYVDTRFSSPFFACSVLVREAYRQTKLICSKQLLPTIFNISRYRILAMANIRLSLFKTPRFCVRMMALWRRLIPNIRYKKRSNCSLFKIALQKSFLFTLVAFHKEKTHFRLSKAQTRARAHSFSTKSVIFALHRDRLLPDFPLSIMHRQTRVFIYRCCRFYCPLRFILHTECECAIFVYRYYSSVTA